MQKWMLAVVIGSAFVLVHVSTASAQVLGSARWQFAPYCNVVTLLVERKGSLYEVTGTDDGCDGTAPASTVHGSAHTNPDGTVGMGLTIVRPDGIVVNATIQLSQVTLSGTWSDNWANSGTFTFNPALAVGPPRQLTMRGDWSISGVGLMTNSFSFPKQLPSPPAWSAANVIPFQGAPTANCPGSVTDPQAAPGQLCLYERVRHGATGVQVFNPSTNGNGTSAHGFTIFANTTAGVANGVSYGTWAVTAP